VLAATVSAIVGLLLTMPALADDPSVGQRCRALRHGTDEVAVCVYESGPEYDFLPPLAPADATFALNVFLDDPIDALCVKRANGDAPFVLCYFIRGTFEAENTNPTWSALGPELDIDEAVLYSPAELTPLDGREPTPQPPAGGVPSEPKLSPDPLPRANPAPSSPRAPSDDAPSTAPRPPATPAPDPSAQPIPSEEADGAVTGEPLGSPRVEVRAMVEGQAAA
jgi:hypothetical protein